MHQHTEPIPLTPAAQSIKDYEDPRALLVYFRLWQKWQREDMLDTIGDQAHCTTRFHTTPDKPVGVVYEHDTPLHRIAFGD